MGLKDRIAEDMKAAMRAKDAPRLDAIRMLRAAIQRREVDERVSLDDGAVLVVLEKLVRQGQESIEQFRAAGRTDLVAKEEAALAVWSAYRPAPLSAGEIEDLIVEAVAHTGATSIKDMGRVVAHLKPRMQGRADMAAVSARIKERLS
ncbi:GatB/YqeY domain-containing protein [Acidiferrobacter sp.]|uniref:GatB/YqeY domain-containing protein n=1 Tax=Acidiferrobacter sp. TaxID=1872107 RepID=UPI002628DDE4|nr:GatB/YqeY domain-containing protein [Acidiferrobacter sp.]